MLETQLVFFLMIISTVLGSLGSLFFKLSANTLTDIKKMFSKRFIIKFMVGASFFVISVIIYTFALRIKELSILFPFIALSYIWTNLFSMIILKEKISKKSWFGIFLICIGVIIISIS